MIIRISKRTPSSHITITNATHREKIFFYIKKNIFMEEKFERERERERERDRKKEKRFKMKAKMNL
jgi:hypothetical protein